MMASKDFRLLRLERRYPRRPAPPPGPLRWDLLTPEEASEAIALASRVRATADGRGDFSALDDDALDRLVELRRRLDGAPAEPD